MENLRYFNELSIYDAVKRLFLDNLNLAITLQSDVAYTADEFFELIKFDGAKPQYLNDISEIHFVGLINDETFDNNAQLFEEAQDAATLSKANKSYEAILVFGVELRPRSNGKLPARSTLAQIARFFNRAFHETPVVVVFRYNGQRQKSTFIAIASTERSAYQQAWRPGEKAGKVSLLRDIDVNNIRRGHLQILQNLRVPKSVSNFDALYAHWQTALDVSVLNKRFYTDYKEVFELVEKSAVIPKEFESKRRDWTQRLFNRLLFLRFLEKKGWLEFEGDKNYLRALFEKAKSQKESFLKDRLFWLFFRGLNTAAEDPSVHKLPQLVERRGRVPFLNGGLFDLKDELDVQGAVTLKKENQVFEKVLLLFEKYYFTVDESTPLDQDVGIDPEMLGKVFEELTNERTDSGSYYTPRVVVGFMAKAALKGYLSQCDASDAITQFVENGDASQLTNPRAVLDALEKVRVCDPACGSGAYLLGMMQELLRLRDALFTAHKIDARAVYDRKLQIIERNLYGVDLMDFAVNIAMLRLWLSLIVDYNGAMEELPALPNLQYKIGCGDSLTAPNPTELALHRDAYQKSAQQLANLHREFFNEAYERSQGKTTRDKKSIRKDIDRVNNEIKSTLGESAPADAHDWRTQFAEVFAQGGFDIVIANPPYGAKVADNTRNLFFDRKTEGAQSKDTYGLFMARGLQLLRPGGWFSYIVSDTWRTIKSHLPLRKRLQKETQISHVMDLPAWIFGATVNTGILTLQKQTPTTEHQLLAADICNLPPHSWQQLDEQLSAIANAAEDRQTAQIARYSYPQSLIASYENYSFFIANPDLYRLMSEKRFQPLGEIADVKVGLQTGDNKYYLRKREGARGGYEILGESKLLSEDEIKVLLPEEKEHGVDPAQHGGRHFVPYDKGGASDAQGGWLPNYYVPTEYFIDWSKDAVTRLRTATVADVKRAQGKENKITKRNKSTLAAVIRNPQFYWREGISFSDSGVYSPTFRLSAGSVFDQKGSIIISDNESHFPNPLLLALLCSKFARYSLKNFINHSISSHVDSIKAIPLANAYRLTANVPFEEFRHLFAQRKEKGNKLIELVESIIERQRADLRYAYWENEQREIDALVYELYGLTAAQIAEVELWYCRRYPRLASAQGFGS